MRLTENRYIIAKHFWSSIDRQVVSLDLPIMPVILTTNLDPSLMVGLGSSLYLQFALGGWDVRYIDYQILIWTASVLFTRSISLVVGYLNP